MRAAPSSGDLGISRAADMAAAEPLGIPMPLPATGRCAARSPLPEQGGENAGLTEAEAAERLRSVGFNALPERRGRSVWRILAETLREPMFLLLVAAAGVYLVLGDLAGGAFLALSAVASAGLVIVQEARSERALAALRDLAQPSARVFRGGMERRIPARDLVPGDLIHVGEGERIPADALLVGAEALRVDESVLTGESAPAPKRPASSGEGFETSAEPTSECSPLLFSGTIVVAGQGLAEVARTGPQSALGRIGASLASIEPKPTALQASASRLVKRFGVLALLVCGLVVVAYGVERRDWLGGVLAGATLAVSLIPEEFPMVLSIFMALGAWRLAERQVLVRRNAIIEALGGATVLCVDKTGTLTENHMRVARLWVDGAMTVISEGEVLPASCRAFCRTAVLASAVLPIDPMDLALHAIAGEDRDGPGPLRIWPLRPGRMVVVQFWASGGGWRAAAKGAPEAVLDLCSLGESEAAKVRRAVEDLAAEGLRVLAIAEADGVGPAPDESEAPVFRLCGLVGFIDPLRPEVPSALREAHKAGIRVIMITGDHPATASAIARVIGLASPGGVLLGTELARLAPDALRERLKTTHVFARIAPDQKLRLVEALEAGGDVVAMTGDGVNDAPALEAADIGIAMGRRGTDVARDAADLVLLDDSFASIIGGVRLGRRIFTNLRRALTFIVAVHVPIGGLALLPILSGLPPLLTPMHIVLLEFAIDPTCALVFEGEPGEAAIMARPPRRPSEPMFGARQLLGGVLQGALVLALLFAAYVWALGRYPEIEARGFAFLCLVGSILALALADAMSPGSGVFAGSRRTFWSIAAAMAAAIAAILNWPRLASVFQVAPLAPLLYVLGIGLILAAGIIARSLVGWAASSRAAPSSTAAV